MASEEELSELRVATAALADDLVAVWRACERIDGPNLSEQLSFALGTAARRLLVETGAQLDQSEAEENPGPPSARLLGSDPRSQPDVSSRLDRLGRSPEDESPAARSCSRARLRRTASET